MLQESADSEPLWRPSSPQITQIFDFGSKVSQKHGFSFANYDDLWQWSISQPVEFWEEVWNYTAIKAHTPFDQVSCSCY